MTNKNVRNVSEEFRKVRVAYGNKNIFNADLFCSPFLPLLDRFSVTWRQEAGVCVS